MSNKNRNQRRGGYLSSGTALHGPMSAYFGQTGGALDFGFAGTRTGLIERMLVRKIMQMSLSRFKWTGLPETVNPRWLELSLMSQALAVFFKDPQNNQFFATAASPAGNYNMVGDPTAYQMTAANGLKSWYLDVEHCVPIWANDLRWPDLDIINIYAHRLAETDRTLEINLKNARQPKVLAYPQNLGLTVAKFNEQIEAGNSAVEVTEEFGMALKDIMQVLDMAIHPDLILNTSIMRGRIWTELMTMLGINSAPNSDKKERLVSAEVAGNDDIVNTLKRTLLESRQKACREINEMFPEIEQLPRNLMSKETDEDPENQEKHPGVWVEYATDAMAEKAADDAAEQEAEQAEKQGSLSTPKDTGREN